VLLAATTLLFGIVWVAVLLAGPDTVPGHFGADGTPTRWDPTVEFLGTMALVAGGMGLLFAVLPVLVARTPSSRLNVPSREQWNTPSRRAHLDALITEDLRLIGAATMLLLAAALATSGYIGLGGELPSWAPLVAFGVFVVLVAVVMGRMVASRRYRPEE
jgi:hypothetical protein